MTASQPVARDLTVAGPAPLRTDHPSLLAVVEQWLPRQRWFTAKGAGPLSVSLREVVEIPPGAWALPGAQVLLCFVGVRAGGQDITYQVPLTVHADRRPDDPADATLLGVAGGRWVYDGPKDPYFARVWLSRLVAGADDGPLSWRLGAEVDVDPAASVSVLSGEQSNTSLIVDPTGHDPVIAKLFRVVQVGSNPDVEIPQVLSEAGCDQVPRLLGWVEGTGDVAVGHLAAISEYLPGSVDAWRLACEALQAGTDFTDVAAHVGEATAQVHAGLRRACGEVTVGLGPIRAGLHRRLDWAVAAVPALEEHADAVSDLIDSLGTGTLQAQRIHGDLHLGQVLDAGRRGWVLLDFEGEPLRPLAERNEPDLVVRDIAGMLRSFDYAAGHAALGLPSADPVRLASAAWATACRGAFLAGYARSGGRDPLAAPTLLAAMEVDKALYETVYESRNRPEWVEIPLQAVVRLTTPAT